MIMLPLGKRLPNYNTSIITNDTRQVANPCGIVVPQHVRKFYENFKVT
jgi:hypothetical protein